MAKPAGLAAAAALAASAMVLLPVTSAQAAAPTCDGTLSAFQFVTVEGGNGGTWGGTDVGPGLSAPANQWAEDDTVTYTSHDSAPLYAATVILPINLISYTGPAHLVGGQTSQVWTMTGQTWDSANHQVLAQVADQPTGYYPPADGSGQYFMNFPNAAHPEDNPAPPITYTNWGQFAAPSGSVAPPLQPSDSVPTWSLGTIETGASATAKWVLGGNAALGASGRPVHTFYSNSSALEGKRCDDVTVSGVAYQSGTGADPAHSTAVPGATVRLLDSTSTVVATTTSAADGSYRFTDLAPGAYSVSAGDVASYIAPGDPVGPTAALAAQSYATAGDASSLQPGQTGTLDIPFTKTAPSSSSAPPSSTSAAPTSSSPASSGSASSGSASSTSAPPASGSSSPPAGSGPASAPAIAVGSGVTSLASTGTDLGQLMALGGGLLAAGCGVLVLARRRHALTRRH